MQIFFSEESYKESVTCQTSNFSGKLLVTQSQQVVAQFASCNRALPLFAVHIFVQNQTLKIFVLLYKKFSRQLFLIMFRRIPVHFNVTAVTIATSVTSSVVVTAVAYRDRGATLKEVGLTSDSKVVGLKHFFLINLYSFQKSGWAIF